MSGAAAVVIPAPRSPVYRVGYPPDPFAPPPWAFAQADGTFGNRFDDPGGRRGIPSAQRFRMLYLASESAGAFGETIAGFRPSLAVLARAGARSAGSRAGRPLIPASWRQARRLGTTVLRPSLPFVDMAAAETIQLLREILAPIAVSLVLHDVDLSAVTGPDRVLTQEAARYIYEQHDPVTNMPLYAGIRYLSRFNAAWECWAVFTDRLQHTVVRVDIIAATHPGLYDAARILNLVIEDRGGRQLVP